MTDFKHEKAKASKFMSGSRRRANDDDDSVECTGCFAPISVHELAKNRGLCNKCVQTASKEAGTVVGNCS